MIIFITIQLLTALDRYTASTKHPSSPKLQVSSSLGVAMPWCSHVFLHSGCIGAHQGKWKMAVERSSAHHLAAAAPCRAELLWALLLHRGHSTAFCPPCVPSGCPHFSRLFSMWGHLIILKKHPFKLCATHLAPYKVHGRWCFRNHRWILGSFSFLASLLFAFGKPR